MSTKKVEHSYDDAAKHISDNMKLVGEKEGEGKRYQVNQEPYNAYLESRGITKDTLKQVIEAEIDYNDGMVDVMRGLLIEHSKDPKVTINTRTGEGVISASMTRELETRAPATGEKLVKYGVVKIKQNLKSRMDRGLLEQCACEIEAASK